MKRIVIAVILLLLAISTGFGSSSCSRGGYSGKLETITLGENPNETKALIYIAEERGLLAVNGLKVMFKDYDSGAETANAVLKGEVDLGTSAEFVIVGNVLKKENIRSIATISKFQNVYIIGRTDRGIGGIADLKGKRIGVARQTSSEFYLGRFLEIHGMSIQQVTVVNVTHAQSVDALVSGNLDGLIVIQPYANTIKQKLGDNIVIWPAQSGQLTYFNFFSAAPWVASNPEVISQLLRALIQAESYVISHPDEAKAIVQKRLQYDDAYINAVWPEYQFSVSLDQSLILAMEDEARWMIKNNLTTETTVPNFHDYIYEEGLKAVKPEAVNTIR